MSGLRACRLVLVGVVAVAAGVDPAGAGTPPKITDLGGFPGYYVTARGINDAGEIVGEQYRTVDPDTDTRESHGLLWRKDGSGHYLSTEIGELTDFPSSYPRSINNLSRIAGWAETASLTTGSPAQAVMWESDGSGAYVPTDLGSPYGFAYSETANFGDGGHVLNERGQIAGGAVLMPSWQHHAHLWTEPGLSPPIDLSPSAGGADFVMAYGLNDAGLVVGGATGNPPPPDVPFQKALLWQTDGAGLYVQTELAMPVGARARAFDVNDRGQIVGIINNRAAIWEKAEPGGYQPRYLESPPGSGYGSAYAISNSGDVVGWAWFDGSAHAALWPRDSSGQAVPTDLGTLPGFTRSAAYGINDRGQIVGLASYYDAATDTTVQHAVLWELAVDTTPPTITGASADPGVLWPPNHAMVTVTVSYDATDDGGSVSCSLGPVTGNEPFTPADWRVVDDAHVQLRSERHGSGSGRIYTLSITCTDPSGNSASQPLVVTVPHDQRE